MTRAYRTRLTGSTRPRENNQNNGQTGGRSPFSFNPGSQELPEDLTQVGNTPFYNTPPQIETNDCGQIHPSLAYLCDIDLQDPTSFAEPSYEVSINGCGVCVTMTQNYSAIETVSQTYCYVLPACRPREAEPEPPPTEPNNNDWAIDWPSIPSLPTLPPGDPNQRYRITFDITCNITQHGVCGGEDFELYFDECVPFQSSYSTNSSVTIETQGIGQLVQSTQSYPLSEVQYNELYYAMRTKAVSATVSYRGTVYSSNSQPVFQQNRYLYTSYGWSNAFYSTESPGEEDMYYGNGLGGQVCTATVRVSPAPTSTPSSSSSLPSPQPPMNCCADVKKLMQMVARLERRVGVSEFPVSVPRLLLTDRGNDIVKLQNIPELISWLGKQLDALVGEFPGEIEVEDIDPQTEGNQTRKFKFPNLAELLLEMAGLIINNKVNTETALTTVLNTMVEVGSVKTTAISNYHALQAILDYLSPSLRQSTVEAPLTFTPGETQIHKLLKPTNTKVKIVELDSKTDLQDDLADLKKFAAEWRAQNFRKIKLDGTEVQQIKKLIKGAIIFTFNEIAGAAILKRVGEEMAEELAGSIASLIRSTFRAGATTLFVWGFKNARKLIRNNSALVGQIFGAQAQRAVQAWGAPGSQPANKGAGSYTTEDLTFLLG